MPIETQGITLSYWTRFYDNLTSFFGFGKNFRKENIRLASIQDIKRPISVLEIGCGTGALLIEIAHSSPKHSKIIGIDPVKPMLLEAKRKWQVFELERKDIIVEFHVGVAEQLEFPENSFDVVFSTMLSHHLHRMLKLNVFKEVWRVLKPGGIFLHTDFGIQKKNTSIGKISFYESLRLFSFLYFNFVETLFGNFMKTVLDNFTGVTLSLVKMAGFNEVKYLKSRFKKAVFIKAIK